MNSEVRHLTQAKRNKIASLSIFYILFVSKAAVIITTRQQGQGGYMTKDILAALLLSIPVSLLLSIPVIMCVKGGKNPLKNKFVSRLYSLYFIFIAGVNAYNFSVFASEVLGNFSKAVLFAVLISICAAYCASLGIESIARFSAFAFVIFSVAAALLCLLNINALDGINVFPLFFSSKTILRDTFVISCSFSELAVFLTLVPFTKSREVRCFVFFDVSMLVLSFVMIVFAFAVMGEGFFLFDYPVFALSQTAGMGGLERLDALFTSTFTFGIFLRSVTALFCASKSLELKDNKRAVVITCGASVLLSFLMSRLEPLNDVKSGVSVALFIAFCVVIPLLSLMLRKRNAGDELIESI